MSNKMKWLLFGFVLLSLLGMGLWVAPQANAAGPIVLVPSYPVQATFNWIGSGDFYSGTTLSGVGLFYDVQDNVPYTGYCVEYSSTGDPGTPNTTFTVTLYSTYDPSLPITLTTWATRTIPWDKINYALNQPGYTTVQVADAIFRLEDGAATTNPLVLDALAHGTGFVPKPGQIIAVLLTNGSGINSGVNDGWQEDIILVKIPGTTAVALSSFTASGSSGDTLPLSVGLGILTLGLLGMGGVWQIKRRVR